MFDGFSIGSNDITQRTLGIARNSASVSNLFDEKNEAVTWMLQHAIQTAKNVAWKSVYADKHQVIILNLLSFSLDKELIAYPSIKMLW